jgi:glutamyl-tRNA synthetase
MLLPMVEDLLSSHQIHASHQMLQTTIPLTKERCHLINDFLPQLKYFFVDPVELDTEAVKPKWDEKKAAFFQSFVNEMKSLSSWNIEAIEQCFKELAQEQGLKPGDVQLPFRVMLVGGKFGPAVFEIAQLIGKDATLKRIDRGLQLFNQ